MQASSSKACMLLPPTAQGEVVRSSHARFQGAGAAALQQWRCSSAGGFRLACLSASLRGQAGP